MQFASVVCLAAAALHATEDQYSMFLVSVPAGVAEPKEAQAEVKFVSNGYILGPNNCIVTKTSGSALADKQACKTVIFRAASKPVISKAPVWIADVPAGFVPPQSLSGKPPISTDDYTSNSLVNGEQGTVVVRLIVGVNGKARDCTIAATSGYQALDNAAKWKLCRSLKLRPAMVDGVPVESINFTQVAFYQGN